LKDFRSLLHKVSGQKNGENHGLLAMNRNNEYIKFMNKNYNLFLFEKLIPHYKTEVV
jgi:hypothetical protein